MIFWIRSLFVLRFAITVSPFENSISLSDRSTVRMWTDRCSSVYRNILRYRSRHNISLIYCPYQSEYWYDCFCNENRVKSESFFILPYPFEGEFAFGQWVNLQPTVVRSRILFQFFHCFIVVFLIESVGLNMNRISFSNPYCKKTAIGHLIPHDRHYP